jgi:AraC-like DNA-binding protein/mannose-6-phosphate isomerase-like protein (cupin superfamily)
MSDSQLHLLPLPFYGEGTFLHHVEDAAGVVCDPHHHLYHELDYILKGQGVFAVGSRKFQVSPGDVIYLARGVYHWRMSDAGHPLELCNLTIDDQDMRRVLNAQFAGQGGEWPWWRHWPRPELKGAETRAFLGMLVGLMRKRPHAVRLRPWQIRAHPMRWQSAADRVPSADVERLLPGIAGLLGLVRAGGVPDPGLHALVRRVRLAPNEPLSLDKEAERLGVSRWWLSRVFKRRFGVTLWEHRDYARADLAIRQLLTSDIPVGNLGRSLGYTGTAQFIATFKRLTGLTPNRLRQRYRQA